ncbi:MAG: phosphatidylserine decarboxylase [archaeon]
MLGTLLWILFILVLLYIAFQIFHRAYFLRDPARKIPIGDNIVCPADGKVMSVKKFGENNIQINKKFLGKVKSFTNDVAKKGYIVSIFMSPFDVHINRAPISGQVEYVKHNKGKFLNAESPESTFENENTQILFDDNGFKVKTIQISGFLARRIVSFVKKNEKVIKGQRIGLIKLGSQVTMILPESVKIKVQAGQKVTAGTTIIAEK